MAAATGEHNARKPQALVIESRRTRIRVLWLPIYFSSGFVFIAVIPCIHIERVRRRIIIAIVVIHDRTLLRGYTQGLIFFFQRKRLFFPPHPPRSPSSSSFSPFFRQPRTRLIGVFNSSSPSGPSTCAHCPRVYYHFVLSLLYLRYLQLISTSTGVCTTANIIVCNCDHDPAPGISSRVVPVLFSTGSCDIPHTREITADK